VASLHRGCRTGPGHPHQPRHSPVPCGPAA